MSTALDRFSHRYRTSLDRHLRARAPAVPKPTRALGEAAVTLNLPMLGLARLHDAALTSITAKVRAAAGRDAREAAFFEAASGPLVAAQSILLKGQRGGAATPPPAPRRRVTELAVAQRRLKEESKRRQHSETNLRKALRHQVVLLAQSRRLQQQLRHLAHQLLSAQEEERKEISRELHDEIAQTLTGINVHLATLKLDAAANTRGLKHKIARTQRLVEQSVRTVHRFARDLRPALLDDLGLIPALRSCVKEIEARGSLRIRFTSCAEAESLPAATRTALYRITQEALTNVVRHAQAKLARVTLSRLPAAIQLEVSDDGRSFPAARILASRRSKRFGLLGMRERVEMVGGSFTVESTPGRGTIVRAQVPFRQEAVRASS